jgi:hypothetical protein
MVPAHRRAVLYTVPWLQKNIYQKDGQPFPNQLQVKPVVSAIGIWLLVIWYSLPQ